MAKRGPRCQVCRHEERWRIELLKAGGASLDSLAEKFKIDRTSLHRHWHKHVTAEAKAGYLAGPAAMADLATRAADEGDSVIDYLRVTRTTLMASMMACSEAGDGRGAAAVAGTLISCLENIGRITGQIAAIAQGSTTINVALVNSPAFAAVQAEILRALAAHPAARADVVDALRRLDTEDAPMPILAPPALIEGTATHVD